MERTYRHGTGRWTTSISPHSYKNGYIGLFTFIFLFLAGIYAAAKVRYISNDPVVRDLALSLIACQAIAVLAAATFDLLAFSTTAGLTFVLVGVSGALLRVVSMQATASTPMRSAVHDRSHR